MSVVAGLIPVTQKASNVCAYCRVRKQRCDRTLPRCQRCAMKGRHCDYTPFKEPTIRPEDDDSRPLVQQYDTCLHADITSRGASELLHATATWASSRGAPAATSKLSEVVYDILDLADADVPQALAEFGPCIQQWCPVVPTTYLRGGVDDLSQQGQRRDKLRHPLLLLCLWLVTRRTCEQEDHMTQCQLYRTLKQILPLLQLQEHFGLETLQMSILVTIYEVGHGLSKPAFQTISTSISLLKLLDLSAPGNPSIQRALSLLTPSIHMLSATLTTTSLTRGFPLALLPNDPLTLTLARSLPASIPSPSPTPDATSPRKLHVRSAVSIAASHVLSHLHNLSHSLPQPSSYADVDARINTCINLLIDKPQPHSWLNCDAIALALCTHILLQEGEVRFLHSSSSATAEAEAMKQPGALSKAEHAKARLALGVSRRMAWDMVRVKLRIITSQDEITRLPFAGLCCVIRAGLAVLETGEWVDARETIGVGVQEDELRVFRRLVAWFSGRWGVGKGYLGRVDEVFRRRGLSV